MTRRLLSLLPLLARAQFSPLPYGSGGGDTLFGLTPRPPFAPTPPPPCDSQEECDMLALPCETRLCENFQCVFSDFLLKGEQCGGAVNFRNGCTCSGTSPFCDCQLATSNMGIYGGSGTGTGTAFGGTPMPPSPMPAPLSTRVSPMSLHGQTTTTTTTTTITSSTSTSRLTTEDGDPDTGTLSEVVVTNRLTVATPERSTPQATPESVGIGSGTNAAGTTVSTSAATTAGTTAGTITAGTDTQMPAIESAHGLFDSIHNSDEKPPIGIIVGAIVGCIALLGLIAAVAFFVSRRSRDSMPTTPQTVQPIPSSSPAASSTMTMTTSPMTFSQVPSGTSEYGAAPVFPPSGEYGVAPSLQPYDSPPPQMFADYESVRDPLQL